ncbi:hypothetical protein PENNAL_c0544G07202 [Penicillium nalgiovense]|uniref:Uncharacterized protein n=1 Tax=Penicillium nalgiovense TaxID=60175 RepID=A0A1V6VFK6_PENNA|nr:hypothetical protein PENNAL_c0544G07202 [Penicillium nalgiovense]
MPLPQQPTELIYCAAPACIPKAKLEYIRRRTEDNRPQAREQGPQLYAISSSLVLATEHLSVQTFVLHNTNTITDVHATVHRSSPAAPEHPSRGPIAESEITPSGTTTRAPSRLLPSTSPPSYHERRSVGSSRAFDSQKLAGAPSVAFSKRQPEIATNRYNIMSTWREW